jgi:hypothetical protein
MAIALKTVNHVGAKQSIEYIKYEILDGLIQ